MKHLSGEGNSHFQWFLLHSLVATSALCNLPCVLCILLGYSWPQFHFSLEFQPPGWFLASILAPQLFGDALGQTRVVFQPLSWSRKSCISVWLSHWLFSYIFLWSVVIHSKKQILLQFFWIRKSRNATEQFSHPKERSWAQGSFYPNLGLWFTCKRLNFNFFASSWEIARWNLPQAFALLQPLINLSSHLLLHILPSIMP